MNKQDLIKKYEAMQSQAEKQLEGIKADLAELRAGKVDNGLGIGFPDGGEDIEIEQMNLRDMLARDAMNCMLSKDLSPIDIFRIGETAYAVADAMLDARKK